MEKLAQNPYLILHTEKGQRYFPLIGKSYWTVGRSQDNDLIVKDHCISRNHAILQATETGDFLLIDLGSRNGTFVNGRRVGIPVTLRDEDEVIFGKTIVEFYRPSPKQLEHRVIDKERDTQTSVLHERRLTSVMVVDMRNFTVLTRQLDEEILSSLIGNWFREAGNIIRDAGSWVDKYIGDAVMAIWFHGQKEVDQKEIVQIFRAVSQLNQMTQELSREYPLPFGLKIGAGVNTGYAMVGNTGSGEHPDYTAIGDTVNAAFRLESSTKEIGVDMAIGQTTYNYLLSMPKALEVFQKSLVHLKGYEQPTLTYGVTFSALENFLTCNLSKNTAFPFRET